MRVFRLCLIVLLILTSHSLAAARGQARIAGQQVICSGSAVTTVYIDRDGRIVPHLVICPDMALGLMAGVAAGPVWPAEHQAVFVLSWGDSSCLAAMLCRPEPQARDPPGAAVGSNDISEHDRMIT